MNKAGKGNNFKSPNTIKYVEDLQNENDSHKSNSKRKNKRSSFITQYTNATDQRDSNTGGSICSLAASVCPSSSLQRYSQFDKENKVVIKTRSLEFSPETESSSEKQS